MTGISHALIMPPVHPIQRVPKLHFPQLCQSRRNARGNTQFCQNQISVASKALTDVSTIETGKAATKDYWMQKILTSAEHLER
jgi:hypothetical protein